jgi:hypothetical protein
VKVGAREPRSRVSRVPRPTWHFLPSYLYTPYSIHLVDVVVPCDRCPSNLEYWKSWSAPLMLYSNSQTGDSLPSEPRSSDRRRRC